MHPYLKTIHTRSEAHKKRFALLVSGSVTLIIFAVWSTFSFRSTTPVVADANGLQAVQVAGVAAALPSDTTETPFEAIRGGFENVMSAVRQGFSQTKSTIQSVDVNQQYQTVRNDALNTNGN